MGLSVLEAMLISFLFELDGHCDKKEKRCVDAEEEIQLEIECHRGTFIQTKDFSFVCFPSFILEILRYIIVRLKATLTLTLPQYWISFDDCPH